MHANPAPSRNELICPHCRGALRLREGAAGMEVFCGTCNTPFAIGGQPPATVIPDSAAPTPPAEPGDAYLPEVPLSRTMMSSDVTHGDVKITDVVIPFSNMRAARPGALTPRSSLLNLTGQEQYTEYRREARPPLTPTDAASDPIEVEARIPRVDPRPAADYLALAAERGILQPRYEPDPPPRWTFFSGIITFPFRGENGFRFLVMAQLWLVLLTFAAALFTRSFVNYLFAPVAFVLLGLVAVTGIVAAAIYSSTCALAAIIDTANGSNLPQEETMPDLIDWLFCFLRLVFLGVLTAAVGYPLTYVPEIGTYAGYFTSRVLFPILLLSALETDSFLLPYSPAVLRTLPRYWWVWLMYFALTELLVFAFDRVALVSVDALGMWAGLVMGPVLAWTILVYARLTGRLGWRISRLKRKRIRPSGAEAASTAAGRLLLPPDLDKAVDLLG